jgi:DNA-binding MarR family transcriptional regulator
MGLEKEIGQQKPFRNNRLKSMANIIYTCSWTTERLKEIFKRHNLTMQQYNILRILRGSKVPMSTNTIRERMLDKMSDTSRVVERMVRKSLVRKKFSLKDRRLVDITITGQGLALLRKIDQYDEEITGLFAGITENEAITLNRLLDKIRKK